MKNSTEEYKLLKEEILNAINTIKNYQQLMYTIIVAILAFAFTQDEPIIFLIPNMVIIPTYMASMKQISSMLRIGGYLMVFLEGDEFHWETRLMEHDNKIAPKNPIIGPYISMVLCCSILCVFKTIKMNYEEIELCIRIIFVLIVLMICFVIMKKTHIDYRLEKQKYIDIWRKVKIEELNKKKITNKL